MSLGIQGRTGAPRRRPDTPRGLRRGAGRRHRRLQAGLVVLGVVVFGVLPGYLAASPHFYRNVPALASQYVPWTESTHAQVGCERCHVPPRVLARATYRVRMIGEFYLSFVARGRKPTILATPVNEACLACHSDLRSVSPRGDLQIPHRAHVTVLKMDCVECHVYLVHALSPAGKHSPPMVECLRCHDGEAADDACSSCHTEKAAPTDHSSDEWLVIHADKASEEACAGCHQWKEDWCVDCHSDAPRSHTSDWRATHGSQVLAHRSCEACHDAESCIRCHGVVPQLNYDQDLKLVE